MKTIIFLLLLTGLFQGLAKADVYVITDQTNGVYSISDAPDALVPKGYNMAIIKGKNIQDLPITGDSRLYNFSNGSFVINTAAVKSEQDAQKAVIAQETTQATVKASAVSKLKVLGLTDDEIASLR